MPTVLNNLSIRCVSLPQQRLFSTLLLCLFAPCSVSAKTIRPGHVIKLVHKAPQTADVYQRSLLADDNFSYRARVVTTYWRTGHAVAVIISHIAPDLRRIDYIEPDALRGRSIVTDARQQWRFDPAKKELRHRVSAVDTDAAADADTSYALLRSNYVVTITPEVKTWADRKVNVVSITRKSDKTQARKLWIDIATGVVLKEEIYREDGKLALTVAYSDINFHAHLTRSVFDLAALASRPGVHRIEEKPTGETALPLASVPRQLGGVARAPVFLSGYRLITAALDRTGAKPVVHLRYSDGLNLISLFQERRTQQKMPTRVPTSLRAVQVSGRPAHVVRHASLVALNWDTNTLNLTIMGEIAQTKLVALATTADSAISR